MGRWGKPNILATRGKVGGQVVKRDYHALRMPPRGDRDQEVISLRLKTTAFKPVPPGNLEISEETGVIFPS
jgi:hypothetical protein